MDDPLHGFPYWIRVTHWVKLLLMGFVIRAGGITFSGTGNAHTSIIREIASSTSRGKDRRRDWRYRLYARREQHVGENDG